MTIIDGSPQTGSLVRVESIITSLVFDHALRIRLKADTGEKKDQPRADNAGLLIAESNGDTQVDISPDNESTTSEDDNTTVQSKSTNNTMAATNSSTITVVTQPPPPKVTKERDTKKRDEKKRVEDAKSNGANLIGKINNLVTSDLDNITEGRDFLFIGMNNSITIYSTMLTIICSTICAVAGRLQHDVPLRCAWLEVSMLCKSFRFHHSRTFHQFVRWFRGYDCADSCPNENRQTVERSTKAEDESCMCFFHGQLYMFTCLTPQTDSRVTNVTESMCFRVCV